MKSELQDQSQQRGRKNRKSGGSASLVAHRAFAPLLGMWAAVLGGLVVIVLPSHFVRHALGGALISGWEGQPQLFLAGMAAAILGVPTFVIAAAIHRRARRRSDAPLIDEHAVRQITLIDPKSDLGTGSLDDPLDGVPFGTTPGGEGDLDVTLITSDVAPHTVPKPEDAPAPRELDLAEFAALPSRNAVWIEEPVGDSLATEQINPPRGSCHSAGAAPPPPSGTTALARLRAMPPSELSLVEMVERLAGALHEYRANPPAQPLGSTDLAEREAALTEAMRALIALSGERSAEAQASDRDEPLRAALARFGARTGAA